MRHLCLVIATIGLATSASAEPERARAVRELHACVARQDRLELVGDRHYAAGRFVDALRSYEAAWTCDGLSARAHEHAKMALAACQAKQAAKAERYHAMKLPHAHRRVVEAVCATNGIALPTVSVAVPDTLDEDAIGAALEPFEPALRRCFNAAAPPQRLGGGKIFVNATVAPDGRVTQLDRPVAPFAHCMDIVQTVQFPKAKQATTFVHKFHWDISCRADRFLAASERLFRTEPIAAVRNVLGALDCDPEPAVIARATEMACKVKLVADATLAAAWGARGIPKDVCGVAFSHVAPAPAPPTVLPTETFDGFLGGLVRELAASRSDAILELLEKRATRLPEIVRARVMRGHTAWLAFDLRAGIDVVRVAGSIGATRRAGFWQLRIDSDHGEVKTLHIERPAWSEVDKSMKKR